ncbi:MAG: helix-turn-helix domain-containing protein [Ignavibacteriae bacterium]|nr:helix-turn-helix domain-containing protein [Ignavibacteriota bacterium]
MDGLNKIAESISKRRKSLKITQNDLAEISGVSTRSLKDIETGKGNPTLIQILKIFNSLGLKFKITAGNDDD